MKFVVTGAGGFVGSHLSRRLLKDGHSVCALGRGPITALSRDFGAFDRFSAATVDVGDLDAVMRVLRAQDGLDGVFHLAAQTPGQNGSLSQMVRTNVLGTANIVQSAQAVGVRNIVVSSSMSVYSPTAALPITEESPTTPTTAYGVTKLQAEAIANLAAIASDLHVVCLRYCGIFGWGNQYGSVHLYASQALQGRRIEVFAHGKITRDFVSVGDVVEANLLAMAHADRFAFEVFNVGGGDAKSLGDIAATVVEAVGSGSVVLTNAPAAAGVRDFVYDISKAAKRLGYAPAPLDSRVREYVAELRSHGLGLV